MAFAKIPTFPLTLYHPVYGAKTAKDGDEANKIFQPEHNWFETGEEADAHRTDREAGMVIHQNMRVKLAESAEVPGEGLTPVRLSNQAQESLNAGNAEPV